MVCNDCTPTRADLGFRVQGLKVWDLGFRVEYKLVHVHRDQYILEHPCIQVIHIGAGVCRGTPELATWGLVQVRTQIHSDQIHGLTCQPSRKKTAGRLVWSHPASALNPTPKR